MTDNQDHRDAGSPGPAETDVGAYAPVSAAATVSDLRDLLVLAECGDARASDERLEALGLQLEGGDPLEDQANRLLDESPPALEASLTFEVVLATGGPDRRLCFECDVDLVWRGEWGRVPDPDSFAIRRVLFRYSWWGSAEVELRGDDREAAEDFARRVVPELGR